MKNSSVFPVARVTLRAVIVFNWLFGGAILTLLMATLIAEQWTFTALGIPPTSQTGAIIMGLRAIAVLGLVPSRSTTLSSGAPFPPCSPR